MEARTGEGAGAAGPAAEAEARSRAWALLADLASRGPVPADLEAARLSPLLEEALRGEEAAAAAAADHERVFGLEVFPVEGFFLDAEGRAGGAGAAPLEDLLRRTGAAPAAPGDGPEPLATALAALAHLSGAEADALLDGLPAEAGRVRALARELLDDHLLRWLPVLALTARRCGAPFPAALAAQVEELALLHRETLGPPAAAAPPLPGGDLDPSDPETGLREIALHLCRPALAGIALARSDLARISRDAGVPRGFGDRATETENLLLSAASLERLGEALGALEALLRGAAADLDARAAAEPALAPFLRPWRERADRSIRLVLALREGAAAAGAAAADGSAP
ncbi:MAG: molecular chaperone TorD family protein [Planctomycetes bacterium]|nr:molecular chaperone TorD family protein [Planctomycetota bacterium]